MIKCDQNGISVSGPEVIILAECSEVLRTVKNMLAEKRGEEYAKKNLEKVWETAFMSDEEIAAKNKEMEAEMSPEEIMMAKMLVRFFGGQR